MKRRLKTEAEIGLLIWACFLTFIVASLTGCTTKLIPPQAGVTTTCGSGTGGTKHCVHKFLGNSKDTIYFVHGFTSDHTAWYNSKNAVYKAEMAKLRGLLGDKSPTVVLISYGQGFTSWMLSVAPKRLGPANATVDHFVSKAMPEIENKFGLMKEPGARRYLYGMSMGGINSANVALSKPNLWHKVILQNAMIIDCIMPPWGGETWMTLLMCPAGFLVTKHYSSAAEYAPNDPLARVKSLTADQAKALPAFLVTGAMQDEWKLYASDLAMFQALQGAGVKVEWADYDSKHDSFNADVVYKFLTSE